MFLTVNSINFRITATNPGVTLQLVKSYVLFNCHDLDYSNTITGRNVKDLSLISHTALVRK